MIDQEDKEEMQEDGEASLGCSQNKEFNKNPEENGDAVKVLSEFKEIHSGVPVEHDINLLNRETFSNEGFHGSMYQSDFYMWPPFHHDFHKVQQYHWNPFDNGYYSMNPECGFPFDSRYQCISFNMFPQAYHPHEFPSQEFQYFVVIDFEATCDKEKIPNPQEIIEFPSVLVNSLTGQLEASFQTYVRPIYHQLLSEFCKELTGIQQIQVDRGVSLSEALMMHDKWLEDKGIKHTSFAVVTWSNWDCQVMLESECRFKKIRKPTYFNRWINLKIPFGEVFGGVRCNLKEAIRLAGLTWEGRAHCGLDDARNTARLLANLMHRGFKFSITDSLMCPSPDNESSPPQPPEKPIGSYHHYPSPKHPTSTTQYQKHPYCFCGAKSCKLMASKPGQKFESCFYSCGYWTATRGPLCNYFKWAYP